MIGRLVMVVALCCWTIFGFAQSTPKTHYVCIMGDGTFHDHTGCALLQMCTGGKYRKTMDVDNLRPCKKCARPVYAAKEFTDIKRVLGVKDRKQIADSLGTPESTIKRNGYTLRISGVPGSKTVNTLEFFVSRPVEFVEDSLLSPETYSGLNLHFDGCTADTIRNLTPHPVTGTPDKTFSIEYRGCAVVERRDAYDDVSKYVYRLTFIPEEKDRRLMLQKIVLVLDVQP
jgi:hypothetical protein